MSACVVAAGNVVDQQTGGHKESQVCGAGVNNFCYYDSCQSYRANAFGDIGVTEAKSPFWAIRGFRIAVLSVPAHAG